MKRLSALIFIALFGCLASGQAASLGELLDEASHRNPDIAAALNAWQASAQVVTQVSTRPDPQVTVQHVAVGSPRPFAGYSNSDFAYLGFGVSQDLPWPGKLRLRAEAADRDSAVTRQKFEATRRDVFRQIAVTYSSSDISRRRWVCWSKIKRFSIRSRKSRRPATGWDKETSRTCSRPGFKDQNPQRTRSSSRTDGFSASPTKKAPQSRRGRWRNHGG